MSASTMVQRLFSHTVAQDARALLPQRSGPAPSHWRTLDGAASNSSWLTKSLSLYLCTPQSWCCR